MYPIDSFTITFLVVCFPKASVRTVGKRAVGLEMHFPVLPARTSWSGGRRIRPYWNQLLHWCAPRFRCFGFSRKQCHAWNYPDDDTTTVTSSSSFHPLLSHFPTSWSWCPPYVSADQRQKRVLWAAPALLCRHWNPRMLCLRCWRT